MSAGLRDKLPIAAKGFLNAEEVQQVTKLRSDDEQINEVIEILKKKTDKDFQTFLGLLRLTNQGVWASELEREAEEFKQSSKCVLSACVVEGMGAPFELICTMKFIVNIMFCEYPVMASSSPHVSNIS